MKIGAWLMDRPESRQEIDLDEEDSYQVADHFVHRHCKASPPGSIFFVRSDTCALEEVWRVETVIPGVCFLTVLVSVEEARKEIEKGSSCPS